MSLTEFVAITILSLLVAIFGFYAFAPQPLAPLSETMDRDPTTLRPRA